MRVGIATQPLRNGYGGILQNYALQRALERLGHQAVTINMLPQLSLWRYVLSTGKSLLLYFIPGKKRPFAPYCRCKKPLPQMREFIGKRIACTETVSKYSPGLIGKYCLDCLVAGSDQVWRPRYNKHLEDMFLRFARHADVKRVAYGASFGVDGMEFSRKQLRRCTPLLQKFDRVSVREASGVALCREYFQAEAEHVLDPAMLLAGSASWRWNVPLAGIAFVSVAVSVYVFGIDKGTRRKAHAFLLQKSQDMPGAGRHMNR